MSNKQLKLKLSKGYLIENNILKSGSTLSPILNLNEGFQAKDLERATSIIQSQLEKRLDARLVREGSPTRFRKRRGQDLFGLKYEIEDYSDEYKGLRFNFTGQQGKGSESGKIHSVDVFERNNKTPKLTIDTMGLNAIQILNLIEDTLEGKIDHKFVYPAEKEIPLPLEGDDDYSEDDKSEEKMNKAVKYFNSLIKNNKMDEYKELFPDKYSRLKTFTLPEGIGRINREAFLDYVNDPATKNPNVKILHQSFLQKRIKEAKEKIDNNIFWEGPNSDSVIDLIQSMKKYQNFPYLQEQYEYIEDYWTRKIDAVLQKYPELLEQLRYLENYQEATGTHSNSDLSHMIGEKIGWSNLPQELNGGKGHAVTSLLGLIINFAEKDTNLDLNPYSVKEIQDMKTKLYEENREEFEKLYEEIYQELRNSEGGTMNREKTKEIQDLARTKDINVSLVSDMFNQYRDMRDKETGYQS